MAVLAALLLSCAALPLVAHAEKADRTKQMFIEADQSGRVDLLGQVMVYSGNVVISQGTMLLRAERVEMRTMADGYRAATATGLPGKPATGRQQCSASPARRQRGRRTQRRQHPVGQPGRGLQG